MGDAVFIATKDLLFRSKLTGVVTTANREVTRDAATCGLAVVDLSAPDWETTVRELRARSVPVLAFGAHVHADLLRAARQLGADAVPNSQVETRLRELLQ